MLSSRQIGVLNVHSPRSTFASALSASSLVESVGADFGWQGIEAAGLARAHRPSGVSLAAVVRPR